MKNESAKKILSILIKLFYHKEEIISKTKEKTTHIDTNIIFIKKSFLDRYKKFFEYKKISSFLEKNKKYSDIIKVNNKIDFSKLNNLLNIFKEHNKNIVEMIEKKDINKIKDDLKRDDIEWKYN